MSLPVRMADSVDPHEIPALYKRKPNGVAAYADGHWAWHPKRYGFPRFWQICVTGDLDLAGDARVLDVETGDATPAHVPTYAEHRKLAVGEPTIVYCARDTVRQVVETDPMWTELEWWISVGGDQPPAGYQSWTPHAIVQEIQQLHGPAIDENKIRAIQRFGTGFDVSTVFGNPFWQPS